MPDHCMHPPNWVVSNMEPTHRLCCWCDFQQYRAYSGEPRHGPNWKAESRDWHWEPPSGNSHNNACPNRPSYAT